MGVDKSEASGRQTGPSQPSTNPVGFLLLLFVLPLIVVLVLDLTGIPYTASRWISNLW